ncbi:MAG TPA: zf-HC2 domain-containing protein [Longimicrobiales bacterium]|nr:zf-HC2 domain-containing protein [Longimicrobiales bacterium]
MRDETRPGACARGDVSCEEALRRVHEYLDGELEDVEPAVIEQHFERCVQCYPHLNLEQAFRRALCRALGRQTASSELRAKLKGLLDQAASQG